MASFSIHLAVGKEFAGKNAIDDLDSFYRGIIDPDLAQDKFISHYAGMKEKDNLLIYLENKTLLNKFLNDNLVNNDYYTGVFVHLITDYIFFNDFFDKNYISNIDYVSFLSDLYYSYDESNDYLIEKYNLDMSILKNEIDDNIKRDKVEKKLNTTSNLKNILNIEKLDHFIKRVSNIDLEKYKEKLIKAGKNILPE